MGFWTHSNPTLNEGFTGANTNYGQSSSFSDIKNKPINVVMKTAKVDSKDQWPIPINT